MNRINQVDKTKGLLRTAQHESRKNTAQAKKSSGWKIGDKIKIFFLLDGPFQKLLS